MERLNTLFARSPLKPAVVVPTDPKEKDWLSGRLFLLLVVAAVVAAFPKVLLGIDTFFDRDFGAICYSQAFYHRESLLRGELPFWNPYNY